MTRRRPAGLLADRLTQWPDPKYNSFALAFSPEFVCSDVSSCWRLIEALATNGRWFANSRRWDWIRAAVSTSWLSRRAGGRAAARKGSPPARKPDWIDRFACRSWPVRYFCRIALKNKQQLAIINQVRERALEFGPLSCRSFEVTN